ncbi:dephospho-CoA kinase [Zoogloea sp.]|uniref:dephospho-CoA kinase n=1 Tax=Zoogloea sp. TaxID=49181 RepID=UPI0035B1065D
MSAWILGLTGGIGSGKTAVANCFAALGVPVIDTDLIAHGLTGPGGGAMGALEAEFGAGVLDPDGALNRPAMRALAFETPDARRRLEAILHPMIRAESDRQCAAASGPYAVLVVPLLVESGSYRERVQRICVVDCPEAVQVARVMARNGLDEHQVRAIMAAQASRAERLAVADDVIENADGLAHLATRVATLHPRYLSLAASGNAL